ncbi:hypothetical protein UlMin_011256 [Ulmus minor]
MKNCWNICHDLQAFIMDDLLVCMRSHGLTLALTTEIFFVNLIRRPIVDIIFSINNSQLLGRKPIMRKPTPNTYAWSAVRQRAMVRLPPPGLKLSGIDGWERKEAGSDGGDDPTATATPDLVRNFLTSMVEDPFEIYWIIVVVVFFLVDYVFSNCRNSSCCFEVISVGKSFEVILTLGSSRTVLEFLCAAKEKKRSFRVFVAEGAPRYQGHLLAKELVSRGLQTTLITDSAVFAMISRVNMVIVGAHAVMANGSVIAPVGLNMVALAAQRHAVPFVVLADSHKLCPLYPHNPEVLLNELRSPSELLDFGEFSDCMDFGNGAASPLLHVVNPTFDYVPPKLVSLFITDAGGYNPSYMYQLIADYYSADDLVVQRRTATGS